MDGSQFNKLENQHVKLESRPRERLPRVDRSEVDPKNLKAAKRMEKLFLNQMFKAMRSSIPENDMDLKSRATKMYQEKLDQKIAQRAADTGGVGLTDIIVAYLERTR